MTGSQLIGIGLIAALLAAGLWCMWRSDKPGPGHDADGGGAA